MSPRKFKSLIDSSGLSCYRLAELTGYSRSLFSRIIHGEISATASVIDRVNNAIKQAQLDGIKNHPIGITKKYRLSKNQTVNPV